MYKYIKYPCHIVHSINMCPISSPSSSRSMPCIFRTHISLCFLEEAQLNEQILQQSSGSPVSIFQELCDIISSPPLPVLLHLTITLPIDTKYKSSGFFMFSKQKKIQRVQKQKCSGIVFHYTCENIWL